MAKRRIDTLTREELLSAYLKYRSAQKEKERIYLQRIMELQMKIDADKVKLGHLTGLVRSYKL